MRMRMKVSGAGVVAAILATMVACGDDSVGIVPGPPGPDASADADAAAPIDAPVEATLPPGCDGTKTPAESACVIDNAAGVFVAPTGDDTAGQGTKSAPFKTACRNIKRRSPARSTSTTSILGSM